MRGVLSLGQRAWFSSLGQRAWFSSLGQRAWCAVQPIVAGRDLRHSPTFVSLAAHLAQAGLQGAGASFPRHEWSSRNWADLGR